MPKEKRSSAANTKYMPIPGSGCNKEISKKGK
jgi:hypothetical protein